MQGKPFVYQAISKSEKAVLGDFMIAKGPFDAGFWLQLNVNLTVGTN